MLIKYDQFGFSEKILFLKMSR